MTSLKRTNQGSILVSILVVMVFLTAVMISIATLSSSALNRARSRVLLLQAQYAAESGADTAIAMLNSGNTTYAGTPSDVLLLSSKQYKATFSVQVAAGSDSKQKVITAVGKVYRSTISGTPDYTRKIRVIAERSSTTTASSMLSRNIIDVGSGVKQITGRDIYVNGFIMMHKNTTNLIAENITVVGKDTSAANCSIGGSGNLVKPSSFVNAGQTKTKLTLGYNNCVDPKNTSNSSFDVLANQNYLSPVQSTYIPWNQYLDTTYTDAGSCTDWTAGGSIRQIPSISGTKKTHYPNSASNVSTSCGTNGDIDLGTYQYNLTDNAHVRANFCAATGCDPVFNNPTAATKYLFVEGTVNFNSIKTVPGSGPIVLIAYGADPASKNSVCPYGGSIYLGQNGSGFSRAPNLYMLAMNGLCIDGTKFGTNSDPIDAPMLGGVSGKNIYIASSPSTPRPLLLDPSFPVDQVPVDLAWRAVRYARM
jgi:hypothetical protein